MTHPASSQAAWRRLHDRSSAPYRRAGRFAWHFARGKLGRDPIFRSLVEQGLVDARHRRVVDIGCGQGLLASLLAAMSMQRQQPGEWPAHWGEVPSGFDYTGIELMPRDVARARQSIGHLQPPPRLVCGDMCSVALPACELVTIFDVLHYVDHAAQEVVLRRVRDALQPGGRLLLRIGDQADQRRFATSQWVDRLVTRVRGHRVSPTWGRPLAEWRALLQGLGFEVVAQPMSQGTPFANVLLIADRPTP